MKKTGLLRKAEEKLQNAPAETDTTTGISPEDRAEIVSQIEKITTQNRRTFDASAFAVKAQKHGIVFPLVVNVVIIGATVLALYGLSQFFSQRTTEIQRSGTALSTAEGKLIQEIKKEAEGQLAQKEQEINEFQAKLAQLEKEQASLKAGFEERLAQKEAEYKAQVQKEIAEERERLLKQGLSEAVIQERLQKFEAERLAFYKQKLDEFQKQLEQERLAAEASYAKLRQEYASNIASLNAERQKIQEEARQREQQLRSSLEQKNQELASQAAQVNASLEEAKKELARIDEQRRASAAAEDQIAGLYQAIQTSFQTRRFDEALKTINSLKSILNDPAISSLPSLQKRRNGDLFALDVMGQMARLEVERSSIDTNLLLAQAEALAAIRSAVQEGRTALKNNNPDGAAEAFQRALSKIPEVTEAHQYFINRSLSEKEGAIKTALSALSRAATARINKDYAAASLAYGETLQDLGLSADESLELTQGISAMAVEQNKTNLSTADTNEARNLMRRGKNELDQRNWGEAIKIFASLLKKHPNAEQTGSALEGIDTALLNMTRDAERVNDEAAKKLSDLEAKITQLSLDLEKTVSELNKLKSNSAQAIQEKDRRITELEQLLEEERQKSKALAGQAGTAPNGAVPGGVPGPGTTGPSGTASGTASGTLEQDLAQLRAENQRLNQIASQYDALSQAYQSYKSEEDRIIGQSGSGNLVAARSQLESFLTDSAVQRIFPGIRDRILRYERAYIEAGQKESLYNAMTIADTAFKLKDEASRARYFQDLKSRYRDNEAMLTYIDALQRGLR
jgi:phage shock protein A